jgi:hypothetical protein
VIVCSLTCARLPGTPMIIAIWRQFHTGTGRAASFEELQSRSTARPGGLPDGAQDDWIADFNRQDSQFT